MTIETYERQQSVWGKAWEDTEEEELEAR